MDSAPLVWQPLVPVVMPKVLLPEVPLVVAATTWVATPRWPLKSMLPQPQPAPPGASAKALKEAAANRVPSRIRFIVCSLEVDRSHLERASDAVSFRNATGVSRHRMGGSAQCRAKLTGVSGNPLEPSRLGKVLVGLSETGLGQPFLMREVDMSAFDPATALETLATEYAARAAAIRRDLARSHSPDFAEQAVQRQNDEVLEGLLAEAEAGMRQVGLARLRLAEGRYGYCERCGGPSNRRAWPPCLRRNTACAAPTWYIGEIAPSAPCQWREAGENAGDDTRGDLPPDARIPDARFRRCRPAPGARRTDPPVRSRAIRLRHHR